MFPKTYVLPFVFVKKQRDPDLSAWHGYGRKIKKETCESRWTAGGRETRMLFLTRKKQTQVFSPVTWPKAPKVHQLTGGLSIHARLELVPFFKAKNLDSLL